jgi:hypothetical protein
MGLKHINNCIIDHNAIDRDAIDRDVIDAIIVIFKDVVYDRKKNQLRCNVVVAKPFGEVHELDTIGFPEIPDARYWIRVAILRRVVLDLEMDPKFYDKYLREPFKVLEYDEKVIPLHHTAFLEALGLDF